MASPSGSGTSSGSSGLLQNSGSEEDLQQVMDQRKRKRMISNRESARRSRMRKQKHMDDLMSQVSQLRKDNNQLITSINVTTQQYLNVEAENSVLRAQMGELCHRLQSLNEIIAFLNANGGPPVGLVGGGGGGIETQQGYGFSEFAADGFMNSWNNNQLYMNHQPLMASADMLLY